MILDGAHNADAGKVLLESLRLFFWRRLSADVKVPARVILVTGMVAGHDPAEFYRELAPIADTAHVVPIEFHRAVSPAEIGAAIELIFPRVEVHDSALAGLEAAVSEAGEDDVVVVTGSFYLVGELGRAIGLR